jgi:DNA-binding transcriptional regulator YhcF (GntR family)
VITVDTSVPTPPYEQIRSQLAEQITTGTLVPGARLPTVRQLANDLGLAVNTVARAYRELEAAELVETRGRAGTIVRSPDAAQEQVRTAADRFAAVVRQAGISPEQALRLVRTALSPA